MAVVLPNGKDAIFLIFLKIRNRWRIRNAKIDITGHAV
jgi:hypothetical protein